ncbi:MAG: shikimate kinase [Actinomycetota bacterium]
MVSPARVVFIGPPGSGKSTVAALVAQRLGVRSADADALIEARAGRPIADIFVDEGEATFREIEREICAELLADNEVAVIAFGGGAILDAGTQALTTQFVRAGGRVVFLDVTIADAAGRVGFSQNRPLLAVNPRAQWTSLMAQRRPVYERVATARVDTAGRTVAEVVTEALQLVTAEEHDA